MNGYEFKREIERIFKVARNIYPNVTDEMLYTNGAIHYMNGNDSTPFDWNCNNRLCEFFIFHKNEMGFIKAFVNSDNTIDMYIYETDDAMQPNGTINYDSGFCDEYNKNAITIYAKDLNGLFKYGMILKESLIGIQTISQDYIEFLLENNGLSREDCLCILSKYIG